MARWTPPLRIPAKPHRRGDRLVPVNGCGCVTCVAVRTEREDAELDRHGEKMAALLGLTEDDLKPGDGKAR